jgi:hypothetical protein
MLLLFNEPFTPGDMVTFRTGNTELIGRVERVGWGQTRIRGIICICMSILYLYINIWFMTCIYVYIYIYMYMYICIHIYIYIYIHTYVIVSTIHP